jgi:hypothetical protein
MSDQAKSLFLVARLRLRPREGAIELLALLNLSQNLCDQQRLLDAGNDPQHGAAVRTGLDVNVIHALDALPPAHQEVMVLSRGEWRLLCINPALQQGHEPGIAGYFREHEIT